MVTLRFRFLAGHYHSTPWGSHVNEGQPEWPPSPWRILRTLIAVWHLKVKDSGSTPEESISSLVDALGSIEPEYCLPEASTGHSRHYMPLGELGKDGYPKTTKVIDSFVVIGGQSAEASQKDCLDVCWNVDLSEEQRALLDTLAAAIGYLGRAESLVECELLPDEQPVGDSNCVISETKDLNGKELIRLLAPETPTNFKSWREGFIQALELRGNSKGKNFTKKSLDKELDKIGLPENVYEALQADTAALRKAGWSQPPGSRWLSYVRPFRSLTPKPVRSHRAVRDSVTVVRLVVSGPVLPSIMDTVRVSDALHRALAIYSDGEPVFTGKENGEKRQGHQHAYIVPEPNRETGLIDRVTFLAREGFNDAAQWAFDKLQNVTISGKGSRKLEALIGNLKWTVIFKGNFEEAKAMFAGEGKSNLHFNLFESSKEWISLTPFLKTIHTKRKKNGDARVNEKGVALGSAIFDVERLLTLEGKSPVEIKQIFKLNRSYLAREIYWQQFARKRRPYEAAQAGFGFEVAFAEKVAGPILVGKEAHFGLGLFVPALG